MEDLEEGEIVEDTGVCKESCKANDSLWRSGMVVSAVTASSFCTVKPARLRRNSSSDSENNEEQASSSDDDYEPGKKKWTGGGDSSALTPTVIQDVQSDHSCPHGAASRPKKKYGIWGAVLAEQNLSKDLSSWFGMNKKVESDRDVETYDYRNAQKDDPSDIFEPCEPPPQQSEDNGQFDASDICDKETFGTDRKVRTVAVSSSTRVLSDQSNNDDMVDDSVTEIVDKCSSEVSGKRRQYRDPNRPSARSRLGVCAKDEKTVCATGNDDPVTVGEEICRRLNEPEHMKATFVRIAQVLGPSKALDLLHKTENVEEAGGLKILNGQRRRTPGGVYLFLLKGDSSVTKTHHREIFKEQYEDRRRFQKEAKKRRWGEHLTAINKVVVQTGDDPAPCDRKEFFLANEAESVNAEDCIAVPMAVHADDFQLDDPEMLNIELDL